ncbi:response regulator [Leptolyngbya sp. BC1307]|uniref:response regulator n=1 Tax=Leptolyngbya sp. BC1307 TaxID=2029589 RepID=UPI000EFA39F6|nr:response regulator [Leptolyngbya sp. BC1307]
MKMVKRTAPSSLSWLAELYAELGTSMSLLNRTQQRGPISNRPSRPALQQALATRGERPYSILIIDDDEDNLLFAQYAVESMGYQATSVWSGDGAIATALTCFPDIILLDILLKDISGIDVFKRLRQHELIAQVPVIAVTALDHPRDRQRIAAAGFSDYLAKPYMLEELAAIISRHLPR